MLEGTKEAEGDNCSISDVIPLVKKLIYEISNVTSSGIGTFKSSLLAEMTKYFDVKYEIESRKDYMCVGGQEC